MPWARLDDKFHSHPSTWQVGLEANGLFARALSYCADQLTDGFLPTSWVEANVPATRRNSDPRGIVQRLVDAGLFEVLDNGYRIPDYLSYNPSREKVLHAREARQRAGRAAAEKRWNRD